MRIPVAIAGSVGVLIVAGALKIGAPALSVQAVRAYQLLPEPVVTVVGYGLPVAEIIIGLLLVIGFFTRIAAVAAGLLMLAFVIGIASAWARGLRIDCGCFGGGGELAAGTDPGYGLEIARDAALALVEAVHATLDRHGMEAPRLQHGDGAVTWPLVRDAFRRGIATRIGLEDTLHDPNGAVTAGNAALVRAAVRVRGGDVCSR